MLQTILKLFPIKSLIITILEMLRGLVEKTETKIDDKILDFVISLVGAADIVGGKIVLNGSITAMLSFDGLKMILAGIIEAFEELAAKTDNTVDDALVEIVKELLTDYIDFE